MSEIEKFIHVFAKEFDKYLINLLPSNKYSLKLYKAMK